jgi:ATP-dependent helicase/nuclease subunit A
MSIETILEDLDDSQRAAAAAGENTVAAAGAGAGKTKVLASRYAWLVMEKKYRPEQIVALTFTRKAAAEMYSRIYKTLKAEKESPEAGKAIADFNNARISTVDSFCASIARAAARHYGISPDFSSDDAAVKELALRASLPFVLDHRDNPALRLLLADRKIRTVAEELFAGTILNCSSISSPLDFEGFITVQARGLLAGWEEKIAEAERLLGDIENDLGGVKREDLNLDISLRKFLAARLPAPDPRLLLEVPRDTEAERALRSRIAAYFEWLASLRLIPLRGGGEAYAGIRENVRSLRDSLCDELETIANTCLQFDIIRSVYPLAAEFQTLCNKLKREAGVLSFRDIARLAVDALRDHPEIRQVYKDEIMSIMIDEFQDNNSLQRDLIFLLAEKKERMEKGLPAPGDLDPGKMFFVGDEKQSIYRFRGADVSVFRGLAEGGKAGPVRALSLIYNYRSNPALVTAFNRIFPVIFSGAEVFEARYFPVTPGGKNQAEYRDREEKPALHICLLDGDLLEAGSGLSSYDLEAAHIAVCIRHMIDSGHEIMIREKGKFTRRPCAAGDFAVLVRASTHLYSLERQFKNFGIPSETDKPEELFRDAPLNDLCNFIRLLVYPEDRAAYAAHIRSPFLRLSDSALSACMLYGASKPFDSAVEAYLAPGDLDRYRKGRERYEALREEARACSITELLTKLWYYEGYRYETIWTSESQSYTGFFDLIFELARSMDARGGTLADFIDYLEALVNREEKPGETPAGAERGSGVRIMTVHKSKGLEFPVVFIYGCASGVPNLVNVKTIYDSGKWGPVLNVPQADELPSGKGSYFFNIQKDEEKKMEIAELKRLLYVAMTRAEYELYLTASLSKQSKKEKKEFDLPQETQAGTPACAGTPSSTGYLLERIKQQQNREKQIRSFLDLLIPVLADCPDPPWVIDPIRAYTRQELAAEARKYAASRRTAFKRSAPVSQTAAALAALPFYENAEIIETPEPVPLPVPASSLHYESPRPAPDDGRLSEESDLDRMMKRTGLEAADLGTIVHAFLEDYFNNRKPHIPPGILSRLDEADWPAAAEAAEKLGRGFLDSDLGRMSLAASYRESEFPVITSVRPDGGKKERIIPISGKIDLLFEAEDTIHVVDFKTDRDEREDDHLGQLAAYEQAVKDIFGKKVRAWLYYLRSGRRIELSGRLETVNMETMVHNFLSGPPVSRNL